MSDQVTPQRISLENWMRDLPAPLKEMPLIYLAIPGSHDSMTYRITRSSGLAPDAEPVLYRLYPLFRGTILRWTITQSLDAVQQLQIGIRYFDLRLATKNGTDQFFFTHGVYAGEITEPLNQIKEFMDAHPDEVVILDFQHLYAFTRDDHRRLARYLLSLFGRKLVPRQIDPQGVTLGSMRRLGQQMVTQHRRFACYLLNMFGRKLGPRKIDPQGVKPGSVKQIDLRGVTLGSLKRLGQQYILIYRHDSVFSTGEFWPGQMFPSPWPQKDRPDQLVRFLETVRRRPGTGFVHQAVLTPTPTFIVLRWVSNLRDKCAIPVTKEVLPTLSGFSPGPPHGDSARAPLNVVIADFVELGGALFTKTVVELNMKLLGGSEVGYHGSG